MKVKDLIIELQKMDQEAEVIVCAIKHSESDVKNGDTDNKGFDQLLSTTTAKENRGKQ
jgi:hypothetical protein